MMTAMVRFFPHLFLLAALFAAPGMAMACQVPVFRFALERWEADAYPVTVAPGASGAFSPEEQAALDALLAGQARSGGMANLAVTVGEEPVDSPVATMTVAYPPRLRGLAPQPIWTGSLTAENAGRLMESPARRELAGRLLQGDSAVWLLVQSGNAEADAVAAAVLAEALEQAESTLKLPDGVVTREEAETGGGPAVAGADDVLLSDVPLKIAFSLMTLSREDPAEAILLAMLMHLEDDLGDFLAEPMVFPVFGRGRVLEPVIGRGIIADNVLDYATYLCGACSCEVKDQNPGFDLVVAADWDTALEGSAVVIDRVLPPLEGAALLAQADAGEAREPPAPQASEAEDPGSAGRAAPEEDLGGLAIGLGALSAVAVLLLVVLGGGTFLILRHRGS